MSMIQINLLPREMRRRTGLFSFSRATLIGLGAVAGLVLALIGLTSFQTMRLARLEGDIERRQQKVASMQDDIALVNRLTDAKSKILKRMEAIETLDRSRGDWVRNLEDVLAVVPDYAWLSGFHRDDQKPKNTAKPGTPADSVKTPQNDYILEGYCYSISSLANLVLNMQDSPRFEKVGLRKAQFTDLKGRRLYQFTVNCLLEPVDHSQDQLQDRPTTPSKLGGKMGDEDGAEVSARDEDDEADTEMP